MARISSKTTLLAAPTPLDDDSASMTIAEFCTAERLSTATYHKLRRMGLGPVTITIPNTRLIRITAAARRMWQARMVALSQQQDAKLAEQRRVDAARYAGRLAARSPLHVANARRRHASD